MTIRYRPTLLTKRGERSALTLTPTSVKDSINPIFVVEPIDWNYNDDAPSKTIDQHLANKPLDLAHSWGLRPAAIDLEFQSDQAMATGEHPLEWLTREARALGLPLLPSVGVGRSPAYTTAAAQVMARDGDGGTVRLPPAEWPINTGGPAGVNGLLGMLAAAPGDIDLVLDLGGEIAAAPGIALAALQGQLASLPHLHDWRSVTIAGAGMPKTFGSYGRGVNVVDRVEWSTYTTVCGSAPARTPLFGDYGIAHPDPINDVNPAWMSISASLRYTTEAHWLVPKGELYKGQGGAGLGAAAVTPLAHLLSAHPEWMGAGHCEMEDWVLEIVAAISGGGSPEQWRKFGTRHHLQVVTDQLASLGVP